MLKRLFWFSLFVCLLTLVGVGGISRAAGDLPACSLLSQADVEAVVGEAFKIGRPGKVFFPAGKSCKYFSEGNMGGTSVNLQVYRDKDVAAEGLYASAAESFAKQERAVKGSAHGKKLYREIGGLGERAFWNGTGLLVLQGDLYFKLRVAGLRVQGKNMTEVRKLQQEKSLAMARELAEKVLAAIGCEVG